MPRLAAVALFLLPLLALPAAAQPGAEKSPSTRPAPQPERPAGRLPATRNSATGLVIPAQLAGAWLTSVVDYTKPPTSDPRLGIAYQYLGPGPVIITVFVYDGGISPGPADGGGNLIVLRQFDLANREIRKAADQGKYQDLKPVAGPEPCGPGLLQFQCVAYSARTVEGADIHTALMLGGWRQNFLKLRVDWPNRPGAPNAAEAALADLTRAQSTR